MYKIVICGHESRDRNYKAEIQAKGLAVMGKYECNINYIMSTSV